MPSLILHPGSPKLRALYRRAFREARELYIASAYLTSWNSSLRLNNKCKFRMIIGKDFGITRKAACKKVLKWLPSECKRSFFVASYIGGFHPKAMFWKDSNGYRYALVGSSNLTEAAFHRNYEANLYARVSTQIYDRAVTWIENVISDPKLTREVTDKWLDSYNELKLTGKINLRTRLPLVSDYLDELQLPYVSRKKVEEKLNWRRFQVRNFED